MNVVPFTCSFSVVSYLVVWYMELWVCAFFYWFRGIGRVFEAMKFFHYMIARQHNRQNALHTKYQKCTTQKNMAYLSLSIDRVYRPLLSSTPPIPPPRRNADKIYTNKNLITVATRQFIQYSHTHNICVFLRIVFIVFALAKQKKSFLLKEMKMSVCVCA